MAQCWFCRPLKDNMDDHETDGHKSTPEEASYWGRNHSCGVERDVVDGFKLTGPVVWLANDEDPFYMQYFQDRAEVEEFVAKLRKAADEAWPIHG